MVEEQERKPDKAFQIMAFPIAIIGSCFMGASTISENNAMLLFCTITGITFICIGFLMCWFKEEKEVYK